MRRLDKEKVKNPYLQIPPLRYVSLKADRERMLRVYPYLVTIRLQPHLTRWGTRAYLSYVDSYARSDVEREPVGRWAPWMMAAPSGFRSWSLAMKVLHKC